MDKNSNSFLDQISAQRIEGIRTLLGLTPIGLAAFLEISTDHVYSLIRGRRSISNSLADSISKKMGFKPADVFNTNFKLKKTAIGEGFLESFTANNKSNPNFFISKKKESSLTVVIQEDLIEKGFFEKPRKVSEVVQKLVNLGIKVNSQKVTKSLLYLSETRILNFHKAPFEKKDGSQGRKMVNEYWAG